MATTTATLPTETPSLYSSDEEILGLVEETTGTTPSPNQSTGESARPEEGSREKPLHSAPGEHQAQQQEKASEAHTEPLADMPAMPEWMIEVSAAAPQASTQLAGLWQKAAALENFDRAFYGDDAATREQFLVQLSAEKPAEFRAMFAAAERILAARQQPQLPPQAPRSTQPANQEAAVPAFNATRYAEFERATNDAVVADLNQTISHALDRALSSDVSEGARRRIANDTLGEIHAALRGDRQLSAQVASVVRGGRLDADARAVVVRLIAARAKGLVAPSAKRVIGEWTSSVLASDRQRNTRQQAAQSRVDITGGALPDSISRKGMRPKDVNYRTTSDEDILAW
jgi:hypothetical protein